MQGRMEVEAQDVGKKPDAMAVWRATMVQRWHANPELAGSGDAVGAHSGRVALLILCLFPEASLGLITAALKHDLGEEGVGDLAGPAKRADPVLEAAIDRAEAARMDQMGIKMHLDLHFEQRVLKFCDRLDAVLWMRFRCPHLEVRSGWQNDVEFCREEGVTLGIGPDCGGVL